MTREIVLDTETTGLSAAEGDRIVEIGCVELNNHVPTGKNFHAYINPLRSMPDGAFRVHGLSEEFLSDKPIFDAEADKFLEFIGNDTLIIHNAAFDMGFLNAELERSGRPQLQNPVIDTVQVARKANPGARASLDALCKHFGIDNSRRDLHGALLDSEILAEVYLELLGGRQVGLALSAEVTAKTEAETAQMVDNKPRAPRPNSLPSRVTAAEAKAHATLIETIGDDALWKSYGEKQ